ncbi:4a-hydroxytetrahydrobiopterin dehydratase [Nocardia amamiensis]|uniref:4a-hydroxytetrahydrobiopterin dehydratase n=1 Tax=Nocardia amamiensis TaxID=404578 RepID=UPI00083266F1|nr:4a-hydroxytetrahydrobiopterin dehydratase [Nocardia amamiensis]
MAQQTLLSDIEIAEALTELPEWARSGDSLVRTVKAPTFPAGIELVREVAEVAETANHHPDIDIRWRKVTFTLSTHSAGGLTALDVALAHEIDRLVARAG